ncbi:MAG TPA: entericidin A/B family lipoprotein [Verrucomicrobiales bacterium]|nr:entericidin A/B family lipoprotein [Verrucomicrobiales bacterium]
MTRTQQISLFLLASLFVAIASTSCSTARGFGRDVSHVGHHIENAAR